MSSLKTSVVIPLYNGSKTILGTLESIFHQELPVDEIIVVDDYSTDDGPKKVMSFILKHHSLPIDLQLIKLTKNQGVSIARNKGLAVAQNPIILLCDADDQMHPSKNKIAHQFFSDYPKAVAFIHQFNTSVDFTSIDQQTVFKKQALLKNLLKNKGQGSSIVLNQSEKTWRFDEKMRHSEDYDLTNRLATTGQLYYMPLELTQLGRSQGSKGGLSGERWAMRKGELKAIQNLSHYSPFGIILIPFLYIYSLLKHFIRLFR